MTTRRRSPKKPHRTLPAVPAAPPTPEPPLVLPETTWRPGKASSPQHESRSADMLARMLHEGCFVLPKFQRPYVWADEQVCRLWDSLRRGYHVGSLIVWERRLPKRQVDFGGVVFESRDDWSVFVVVDGQQRLASIARMVFTDRYFVDLLTGDLLVEPEPGPWLVPAHIAICLFRRPGMSTANDGLLAYAPQHIERWGIDRNAYDHLVCAIHETVRRTHLSVVKLDSNYSASAVVEMFSRLNTEGTPMSREDLQRALTAIDEEETP